MIRTHLKLVGHFWRLCISRETQYRANFYALVVVAVVETFMTILPMLLVYSFAEDLAGWSRAESIAVVGLFRMALAIHDLTMSGGAYQLSFDIEHGDLDLILIRPVNAQIYTAFRYVSLPQVVNLGIGTLVFAVGIASSDIAFTVDNAARAVLLFGSGLVLFNVAILAGSYIAFRATTVNGLNWMLQDVASMGRYPISLFPLAVRVFLTGVMPVAFVTTLPLEALRGNSGWWLSLAALAFAASSIWLLRWWWNNSVRHYASASS